MDLYEKNKLLLNYDKLLEHYNEQIFNLQSFVEVQEKSNNRKQIFSLISDSTDKLDKKLSNVTQYIGDMEKNRSINKKEVKIKNKSRLHFIPISHKKIDNSKVGRLHTYVDSLNHFSRSKKGFNAINTTAEDNPMTEFSTIINHSADENYKKNYNDKNNNEKNNISDINEDGLDDLDMEEINKIQKDILNILQRLENSSVKV